MISLLEGKWHIDFYRDLVIIRFIGLIGLYYLSSLSNNIMTLWFDLYRKLSFRLEKMEWILIQEYVLIAQHNL